MTAVELHDFATGKYADCFGMAVDAGLAIFVMVQGNVHLLEPYLAQFPAGRFVVDHCGMPLEPALRRPESSIKVNVDPGPNYEYFDQVLALARWPNVALKWAHAQGIFGDTHYPFPSLTGFLRRAIDAFGMERVIWASDATVIHDTSWGDILDAVKANPDLSLLEKEWLLGKAVRQWLNWD